MPGPHSAKLLSLSHIMGDKPAVDFAKVWSVEEDKLSPPSSASIIDLPQSGAPGGTSIPENLPEAQEENLYLEKWHECINTFPSDPYSVQYDIDEGNNSTSTGGELKGDDRWNFVMNKLISIENNTSNLTRNVSTLSSKVDAQANLLQEVKSSTKTNEQKINDLYKKQESITAEVDQRVEARFKLLEKSIQQGNAAFQAQVLTQADEKVKDATQEMRDEFIQEQCESRKLNLMFVGIKEKEEEEPTKVITSFLKNRMDITGVRVDTAYRLGKPGGNKSRPILARFGFMAHRKRVWFSKSKIKPDPEEGRVWINEDLPKAAKHVHRIFYKILRKAKTLGDSYEGAHSKGQTLFIGGEAYREENLETLPDVLRPSSLATIQSEGTLAFFGRYSPLSNHHPSPFLLHDKHFTCMEQFLAWSRATLAGEQDLISKTLAAADPIVYKGILNELRNSKPDEWNEQLDNTALLGLRAKFQQNPSLAHYLCSTHPKTLGEASPNKRWGIGFTLTHPNALASKKWPKQGNLLGKSLMIIREELLITKNA